MNLAEMLSLTRPLLFFDLETTGPIANTARIVEIGLIQIRPDGTYKEWASLINPGCPIPKEASDTHGITNERLALCNKCGQATEAHPYQIPHEGTTCPEFVPVPSFGDLAPNLIRGFTNTDFAGFNVKNYDLPVAKAEFERSGIQWSFDDAKIIDGVRLWQLAEPRTLSDFVQRWSKKKLEGAHDALNDIRGTLDGVRDLLLAVQHLPRNVEQLHELQYPPRPKDPSWIDQEGKFAWKDGVAIVNFGKKWNGIPMHKVTKRFWEWMIDPAQTFPADAVEIARNMLAGRLPKKEVASEPTE